MTTPDTIHPAPTVRSGPGRLPAGLCRAAHRSPRPRPVAAVIRQQRLGADVKLPDGCK